MVSILWKLLVVFSVSAVTLGVIFFLVAKILRVAEKRITRDPLDDSVLRGDFFPIPIATSGGELVLGVNASNAFTYATRGPAAFPLLSEKNRFENGYLYYIKRSGQDAFELVDSINLVAALQGVSREGGVAS